MQHIFIQTFSATFLAVLKIFLVIIAAGLLVRKNYISQDILKALAASVVKIFLPCLIFSNIVKNFHTEQLKIWPLLPISATLLIIMGIAFGAMVFIKQLPQKKNMLSLTSMQNAGYFILPLGAVLYPEQVEKFNLYCFLFILGISPIMWSLGRIFISGSNSSKTKFIDFITPPLIANLLSIILVFTNLRNFIPSVAIASTELLGKAAVPTAIFILGGMLGSIKFKLNSYLLDAARVVAVKLFILPAITITILHFTGLNATFPLLCSFLVLEASVAPATANLMQVKHYGGDEEKISSIILVCYALSILTVPLWLSVWEISS